MPTAHDAPTTPLSGSGRLSSQPPPDDPAWLALEQRLQHALAPRYTLLRQIGRGGMGVVYLAREPELKRLVAVKVLTPDLAKDDNAKARFLREAQAAAGIAHPNVVAIHSIGALDDGTPYFVMQYATGESIAARLVREGPVSGAEASRMIGELASALAAAHARGIIHRDVKPANGLSSQHSTAAGAARHVGRGADVRLGVAQSAHSWVREFAHERRHRVRATTTANGVRLDVLESDPIVHQRQPRLILRRRNPRT